FISHLAAPPVTYTLSLHDALPICPQCPSADSQRGLDRRVKTRVEDPALCRPGGGAVAVVAGAGPVGALEGGAERERAAVADLARSEEHTSELQSRENLVCRLLLEK